MFRTFKDEASRSVNIATRLRLDNRGAGVPFPGRTKRMFSLISRPAMGLS